MVELANGRGDNRSAAFYPDSSGRSGCLYKWVNEENSRTQTNSIGTIFSHAQKGAATNYAGLHSSMSSFVPRFSISSAKRSRPRGQGN
jgi:hypothetical protein